ncbi:hypothetical protein BN970_05192 [Mycolicibacterium conceptionense]|uniref:Uncharacterized protein n=1 Tax=Mycolicibacterium conceptionense TaxID=451644 RepID=A0A0U1DSG9_9MYCO|nr:hypothetical protein BN970_05192 [Mycolicibacterium conceptionense]
MSSDHTAARRPVLLVFADSLSYFGPTGGLRPTIRESGPISWPSSWVGMSS